MHIYEEHNTLNTIKKKYSFSIMKILVNSLDNSGELDPDKVTPKIATLWFRDFMPNNPELSSHEINQVWEVFDNILSFVEETEESNVFFKSLTRH